MSEATKAPRASTRWQPKHTITIAAMICIAVVFMPVAAHAAGQLVTLTDSTDGARQARVSSNNALVVEQRPGNINNAHTFEVNTSVGRRVLLLPMAHPARYAISEFSASANSNVGTTMTVILEKWQRASGTGTCQTVATSTTGFSRTVLRTLRVPGGDTVQLTFPSALIPSLPGSPAGTPVCVYAFVAGPASTSAQVGLSGYGFSD